MSQKPKIVYAVRDVLYQPSDTTDLPLRGSVLDFGKNDPGYGQREFDRMVHYRYTDSAIRKTALIWMVLLMVTGLTPSVAEADPQTQDPASRRPAALQRAAAQRAPARGTATPPARPSTPSAAPVVAPAGEGWDQVRDARPLESQIEYRKPRPGTRFSFNLVDAELIELVKIIGNITGRSFIIGGNVPKVKATIYAPAQITGEEAYHTFLSVLQVNGLTVMPAGRYLKIVPVANATAQRTPILQNVPNTDQIITRLQPVEYVMADDLANLLNRFKSPEGDITVYAPTNTLIITDYGASIRRLLQLISMLDVAGTREQIWVAPINYASVTELAKKIEEIFDIRAQAAGRQQAAQQRPRRGAPPAEGAAAATVGGDTAGGVNFSKVIPDERTNSLIIIASEEGYLRILELIRVLDVQVEGDGTLHVRRLQHAKADELAQTLSALTRKTGGAAQKGAATTELFEGEMSISADKATNSLVIVSSLRDYLSLKSVIDKLDTMQRQVFVEAVIMEVSLDKNRKLGIGFHGGKMVGSGDEQALMYGMSSFSGGPNSLFLDPTALTGLAAGVRGPDIPGSSDMVGISIPAFGVALQALQQNSDVNVLSTPHILATDNEQATITVGENVPVLQGVNTGLAALTGLATGGQTAALNTAMGGRGLSSMMNSYSRQDVGITLQITPHINDDNQVRLAVELEISEVKSVTESGPTISKQKAKTTSVVADQQTFVLGGLITDNQVETTTKVPVLGDIPLIGMLFRHKASITKKRNLIIFLTPYIIRSPDDFREIFQRKMAERREFIERYTAFEYHRYDPHLDWARTKGALSIINEVVGNAQRDEEMRRQVEEMTVHDHSPRPAISFQSRTDNALETGDILIEPSAGGSSEEGSSEERSSD